MDKWEFIGPENITTQTRFKEIPQYKEGLYKVGKGVFAWMVPNGSWGESNAGLVVGDGASLLIDTLWDLRYTRQMLDEMQPQVSANPIRTVVNTHADGDHWWGNELVPGTEIIATAAAAEEMRHIKPVSMILMGRRLGRVLSFVGMNQVGHWFQNMVTPYNFQEVTPTFPNRTIDTETRLSIGGREVCLIPVGPAHTQGDMLVHLPEEKILFAADILFIGSTPVIWAGPVTNIIAALERILDMDLDAIVPGHGPVTGKAGAAMVLEYWRFVKEQTDARFQEGMAVDAAAREIVLSGDFAGRPFAGWNSPERMMTNVHTLYRHLQGRKDAPKIPALLNILLKQAKLAHALPDAQPQVMRYR